MLVMKPLLLFSATLLAIFAPIEQTNVTLERISIDGILRKIHEFNLKLINDVLLDLGHDPNSMVNSYLPKLAFQFMNETLHRVGHCYDSSVGDNEVDIFHQPIGNIIASFFKTYSLNQYENLQEIKKRIKTLLHNIINLAKEVAICALNTDPDFRPTKLGLTKFSVLSHEEFLQKYTNDRLMDDFDEYNDFSDEEPEGLLGASAAETTTKPPLKNVTQKYRPECRIKSTLKKGVPSKFDWRDRGVVTPVQFQANCSSCYIFASIGAMESGYMIYTNATKQVKFSEQAIINCYPNGCTGGIPPAVMLWTIKNGLTLDKDAEKYHQNVSECKSTKIFDGRPNEICAKLNISSDKELEATIYHYGPTVVSINAKAPNFSNLKGAWNAPCNETVNHAVLAVGYNETYWFIKNSWDTDWGVKGYLLLPKNNTNKCGIYHRAYVPRYGAKMTPNHTIILNNYLTNLTINEELDKVYDENDLED